MACTQTGAKKKIRVRGANVCVCGIVQAGFQVPWACQASIWIQTYAQLSKYKDCGSRPACCFAHKEAFERAHCIHRSQTKTS